MAKATFKKTVYTPAPQLRRPAVMVQEMFADLLSARGLAWRLFLRNLSSQYRQTILGYVWLFLPPLASTLVWVFLNNQKILDAGSTDIPYAVYVLAGTLLWQGFVDALNSPMLMVQESRAMLTKINFPREALIMAGMGVVLFNFMIRAVLLFGLFLFYDIPFNEKMLLAPIGVAGILLFGLMIGLLLLPLAVLFGDVQRGILIITGFWFFLTPIVYPVPKTWPGSLVATLNPVSPLLITAREWLTGLSASNVTGFCLVFVSALVMAFAGWLIFRLAIPILIERIGS
jgi:lipopolysaccharide transport system permease protein